MQDQMGTLLMPDNSVIIRRKSMDYFNNKFSTSGIVFLKYYAESEVLSHFWGIGAVEAMQLIIKGKSWLLAKAGISHQMLKLLLV